MLTLEELPELEDELELEDESEFESDFEDEGEAEAFLGDTWNWVSRPGSLQRRLALMAARSALTGGLRALGTAAGRRMGGASGARIGRVTGSALGGGLAGLLPEGECFEGECEDEYGYDAIDLRETDALMEHLADRACRTDSEAEAEAFIGALIPLAAKLIPRAASVIRKAAPGLVRGATQVVRRLRRSPATRKLVRTMPTIVKRTAADLARQAAGRRRVTPQRAVRTLARQTARTLARPSACARALRRCRQLNRRYAAALRHRMRR